MEASAYGREAQAEASHWWFVGRRKLLAAEIARSGIPLSARVLDVGTSTGTNFRMLRDLGFTCVRGIDYSEDAIRFCASKGFGPVVRGDVRSMPFRDSSFELVIASDIIEHVEDDASALREIARVLAPRGKALITVPAFEALWGLQDDVSHHVRRYRRSELVGLIGRVGLQSRRSYYFNYLLFGPIWLARQIIRLCGVKLDSENQINTAVLNRLLHFVFSADVATAFRISPPFGVSILAVAEHVTKEPPTS